MSRQTSNDKSFSNQLDNGKLYEQFIKNHQESVQKTSQNYQMLIQERMKQKLHGLNQDLFKDDIEKFTQLEQDRHKERMDSIKKDMKALIDYHNSN